MVIVDTSAWITFFRRDGDHFVKLSVKGLLEAFEAALCGPVEMEFLGGTRPHEMQRIQPWFNLIPYLSNDQKLWRKAANNYSTLRAKGHTLPWNDILIATIALEKGVAVYAHDQHFEILSKELGVSLYEPGYNGKFNPDH